MRTRHRLTLLTIVAALVLSVVAPGAASATEPATTRGPAMTVPNDDTEWRQRPGCALPELRRFSFIRFHLTTAAEAIGIPVTELARALAAGESIASVARDNGVDPASVVAALAAPIHRKIDALVDRGCIRPDHGERLKAAVTARFTAFVDHTRSVDDGERCERPTLHRLPTLRGSLTAAATVIGVDVTELVRALHSGSSIAEVARQHGVDPAAVISALVATAADQLDALVEAECLRPEAAASILRAVTARVTAFVEKPGLGRGTTRGS